MMLQNKAREEKEAGKDPERETPLASSSLSQPQSLQNPQRSENWNVAGEPGRLFQSFPLALTQGILMENHFMSFLFLFHLASS